MRQNPRAYIILSDVHLGAPSVNHNGTLEQDLVALIRYCSQERIRLIILGDLFDYWMEFPQNKFVPRLGRTILDEFEAYNRLVGPALYITGNHDNWTFGHFSRRGFEIEDNYRIMQFGDKKVLLMHGDGLYKSTGNLKRPLMHRIIRNSGFIFFFQKISRPEKGLNLMKLFSNTTRKLSKSRVNRLNKHAEQVLKTTDIDIVIAGHDHAARKIDFEGGLYFNSGAFYDKRTLIMYNNSTFNLVTWQASTKEFVSFSEFIPIE